MNEHKIELIDNHLTFLSEGQRIMVDTGSPVTIGKNEQLSFMGRNYHCLHSLVGNTIDNIIELAGFDFDVLMGTDIMREFAIAIDYHKSNISFSRESINLSGTYQTAINVLMGTPALGLTINGMTVKAVIDTGAKISYMAPRFAEGHTKTTERQDFYPTIGAFTTPIYKIDAAIGPLPLTADFGILPAGLQLLEMIGIEAIIGYDLFNNYRVTIDLRDNKIALSPHSEI